MLCTQDNPGHVPSLWNGDIYKAAGDIDLQIILIFQHTV